MAKTTQGSGDNDVGYELNQDSVTGKGKPTPTRKEKEAARKRPLVSNDRAAARKQARATMQEKRERARIGMANGEERFLPMRDRGPQKRWVRDYVDARFSIGEFLIPIMLFVLVLSVIPQPEVALISIALLWLFFVAAVVDVFILGRIVQKRLGEKYGASRVEKVRMYAAMRALQLRAMRLPKPQVKRRQYPS